MVYKYLALPMNTFLESPKRQIVLFRRVKDSLWLQKDSLVHPCTHIYTLMEAPLPSEINILGLLHLHMKPFTVSPVLRSHCPRQRMFKQPLPIKSSCEQVSALKTLVFTHSCARLLTVLGSTYKTLES